MNMHQQVQERDVPEQLVLTEQRHITAGDLPSWLGPTIGRHWQTGERFGGVSGPVLVIFHGEADEQRAGLLTVAARVEPSHRGACTRITRAQVAFHQILAAYQAVEGWIAEHGKTIAGAPREISFNDFMHAAPDQESVDIAFPIAG